MSHLTETIVITIMTYTFLNEHLKNDVNRKGKNVDFDQQLVYFENYDKLLLDFNFDQEFKDAYEEFKLNELCDDLESIVKETIEICSKYYSIFKSIDRKKILIDECRNSGQFLQYENDQEIYSRIEIMKDNRRQYYESEFFRTIGFSEIDFHEKIYLFSRNILINIKNRFNKNRPLEKDYIKSNNIIYFDMITVGRIYNEFNNLLFDGVTEIEFYQFLNIQHITVKLKILDKQLNNIYSIAS